MTWPIFKIHVNALDARYKHNWGNHMRRPSIREKKDPKRRKKIHNSETAWLYQRKASNRVNKTKKTEIKSKEDTGKKRRSTLSKFNGSSS